MKEPKWATNLLDQVCKDEGRSKKPKFKWFVSKYRSSTSGYYSPRRRIIFIREGTLGKDHKQVLLHEICHWLTQPRGSSQRVFFFGDKRKRRSFHNKRFWLKLKELLTKYDCLTNEYRVRENGYKKNSVNYL